MHLNPELLKKYSYTGPRYTSYPTAPRFSGRFGETEWKEELRAIREKQRNLSLYFHIPFCDTLCYYCGCHQIVTRQYRRAEEYLELLERELRQVGAHFGEKNAVSRIHWGGGTPTYLKPKDIEGLSSSIRAAFSIAPDAEISCEADPRELTREHVSALVECGFNRISLGVQDLDEAVQRSVNRLQPESLVRRVYGWMREAGFRSINIDLMLGLPFQNVESFSHTLETVIDLSPERLAVFKYAHLPGQIRHQKVIAEKDLPDLETRLALQILVNEKLRDAGYIGIGMDHYAKAGDDLVRAQHDRTLKRSFQGYSAERDCDLIGFGASGISETESAYAQNESDLDSYRIRIREGKLGISRGVRLTPDDRIRRSAIMDIMCVSGIEIGPFSEKWGIEFERYFSESLGKLEPLRDDGLVRILPERIEVTETGHFFLRQIAMAFDAYLDQSRSGDPLYSQTL